MNWDRRIRRAQADMRRSTDRSQRISDADPKIMATLGRSGELVEKIQPMLAGQGSDVQGAVLIDLIATWLACHHPRIRGETLKLFVASLIKLTNVNEKIIFGPDGFPTDGLH